MNSPGLDQNSRSVRPWNWAVLARCLALDRFNHTSVRDISIFENAARRACDLGAIPFEIIAGTPHVRYGARITFQVPGEPGPILTEFGLETHPWGVPEWMGLRLRANGELSAKAYHSIVRSAELPFQADQISRLVPIMSSLHNGSQEHYFRLRGFTDWREFAQEFSSPLAHDLPDFAPTPKYAELAFCVSVQMLEKTVEAITLLADYRSLPDDETISRHWIRGLSAEEAAAYELALAGIRSCGKRRLGSWHAMLGWTVDRKGNWCKAASLRFPAQEEEHATA